MYRLRGVKQIAYQLVFVFVGLYVLLPIWALAQMAFDGSIRGWPVVFRLVPKEPTLQVFLDVWKRPAQDLSFLGILQNSLVVALGAALLSVVFGAGAAYAFARYRFPGRQAGLLGLLLGALLPPVALMTPLFVLLSALGIRTSLLGLMIVYTSFSMPFCVWNMRSGFQSVPKELEESAFLDGAGVLKTFFRITLPLALPAIAVAALVAFLTGYSEFAIAWLFIDSPKNVTLAMAISGMIGTINASWNLMAALALMMTLPVVILFYLLQRYLVDRLLFR